MFKNKKLMVTNITTYSLEQDDSVLGIVQNLAIPQENSPDYVIAIKNYIDNNNPINNIKLNNIPIFKNEESMKKFKKDHGHNSEDAILINPSANDQGSPFLIIIDFEKAKK